MYSKSRQYRSETHFFLTMPTPNPAHVVTKTLQMATAIGRPCAGVNSTLIVILKERLCVQTVWPEKRKSCV